MGGLDCDDKYAIVVTTINQPTLAVKALTAGANLSGAQLILIGDQTSPANFRQEGAEYFCIKRQECMPFKIGSMLHFRSYARKNLGYLEAIRRGFNIIIETDDDNIPEDAFWTKRSRLQKGAVYRNQGWVNCYRHFSTERLWPRGFPLALAKASLPSIGGCEAAEVDCPIQQGLADGNPDVDAIYRLTMPLPIYFDKTFPIIISGSSYCPFNSQNTTWWKPAFPLLYLPTYCSFRMTDIWRGLIAQRIGAANGWGIAFHAPNVFQDRNAHDLMRDFADEIPGYLHSAKLMERLRALTIGVGEEQIGDGMHKCYEVMIDMGLVGEAERPLIEAWLEDVRNLVVHPK